MFSILDKLKVLQKELTYHSAKSYNHYETFRGNKIVN